MTAPEKQALLACLHCGGQAGFVYLGAGHPEWVVECRSCIIEGTQEHASAAWNRRLGLISALRAMRDRLVVIFQEQRHAEELRKMRLDRDGHDDLAYKTGVVAGALAWAEGLLREKDDAALLELAGAGNESGRSGVGQTAPTTSEKMAKPALAFVHVGGRRLDERHEGKREDCALCVRRGVKGCARCGEDHEPMPLFEMKRPIDGVFTHWAMCPNGGGPILYDLDPKQESKFARSVSGPADHGGGATIGQQAKAAEPAERPDCCVETRRKAFKDFTTWNLPAMKRSAGREALLDAARDLREIGANYNEKHELARTKKEVIKMCADRLEARAKEISAELDK